MLKVKEIVKRIRGLTHDTIELGWGDEDILATINAGYRFVNRIIKDEMPELMADDEFHTKVNVNERVVELPKIALGVLAVYADNKELDPITREEDCRGNSDFPTTYMLRGFKKLILYPVPKKEIKDLEVRYIPDTQELEMEDSTALPYDLDDVVIEYVVTRLSMSNEFDVSQETTLMQALVGQVQALLRNYDRAKSIPHTMAGYWDEFDGVATDIHKG